MLVKLLLSTQWKQREDREEAKLMINTYFNLDLSHAIPLLSALFSCNEFFKQYRVVTN